jgi:vacuolar-type H+-ATPase subunit C/Vma6
MAIFPKLRKVKKRLTKGGAGDYSYTYGWISAMQNKLIGPKELESYITGKGISEMVANLEGTPYEPEIQDAVGKVLDVSKLEAALERHFLRVFWDVTKNIPKDDGLALEQIFVCEWDLKNLKSVLRGVVYSATTEEVKELFVGFGKFSEQNLLEFAKSQDVNELIDKLGDSPYSLALSSGLEGYSKDDNLAILEVALDLEYLNQLAELGRETVLDELKAYLKMQNEALVLRNLGRRGFGPEYLKELVPYHLTKEQVKRLYDGEDAVKVLSNTIYSGLFKKRANPDITVEKMIVENLKAMSLMSPLGLSSIILFIKQKQIELRNLRTVIIGMTNKLEADEIRSMLIL